MIPHKGNTELFENPHNHLPLCIVCHNTVTAKFDASYRIGEEINPKATWLREQRDKNQALQDRTFSKVRVLPRFRKY